MTDEWASEAAASSSAPRITIVDDDRKARELLRGVLQREGYEVTEVSSGLRLISSLQVDRTERGFRFSDPDAPLDMRMDPSRGRSAAELLNEESEESLAAWFATYGELPGSHRLARAIVARRREQPLRTTGDLLDVIGAAGIGRGRRHNPATLVFQALRIAVNDELGALAALLEQLPDVLRPGGRCVAIAYHSLEDRLVKNALRDFERGCVCPPGLPVCCCGRVPTLRRLTRRPLRPGEMEIRNNPRARSALLRAAERLEEASA